MMTQPHTPLDAQAIAADSLRLAQQHYENFPVASFLLPRHLRQAVLNIYRFARSADDIADEGDASDAERLHDVRRRTNRLPLGSAALAGTTYPLDRERVARTLVVHGHDAPADRYDQLDQWGVERLSLEHCEPRELLEALAQRGCNQVLWECGPELAASALQQGCVQQLAAVGPLVVPPLP